MVGDGRDRARRLSRPVLGLQHRVRLHEAEAVEPREREDGGVIKYEYPVGAGNEIYVPPALADDPRLEDAGTPLLLSEGEKKALIATQEGHVAVSINGVDGARDVAAGLDGDGDCLLPRLDLYIKEDREVLIAFDWPDTIKNTNVIRAATKLARMCLAKGAQPQMLYLTLYEEGAPIKLGLDDFAVWQRNHGCSAPSIRE